MDRRRYRRIVIFLGMLALLPGLPACPGNQIRLKIVLDGIPMRDLTNEAGRACSQRNDTVNLSFSAVNDPDPALADDEIFFDLSLSLADIPELPLGEPIDVGRDRRIEASAGVFCFCAEPREPLSEVEGTLTIHSFSEGEIDGAADLVFTDPEDVNSAVRRSVRFEVTFANLPITEGCSE